MWGSNNQTPGSNPPSFPTPGGFAPPAPGFDGGFPSPWAPQVPPPGPPGPPGGYASPHGPPPPGYPPYNNNVPGYGQPPSGYGPPSGPPPGNPYGPPPGPPPANLRPGQSPYGAPPPGGPPLQQQQQPGQQPQSRGINLGNLGRGNLRQQYQEVRQQFSAVRGAFQGHGYGQGQGQGQGHGQGHGQGYGQAQAQSQGHGHLPPAQPQHYGPHFMNASNQDTQLSFQYSQCTGKKKALCVGINYFGQDGELRGCINDVSNIKNFLIRHFGYKEGDIVTLTDDASNMRQYPTKENIIRAMQWLVKGAAPNDSLFFHYSGHGGQTKDHDGDEADGYDEVIYPVDFHNNGHIVDDLMHDIMVKPLPAGCRLTTIFDSCHSGSALDLPYIYSTEGKIKEPNLVQEAGQGLLSAVSSYARGDMGGVFKSAMGIVKTATGSSQRADKKSKATRTSPADVISWSGCKDSQTSADTQEAGTATGAMSFAFISTMSQNSNQTYQELLVNIRDILKAKYSQKPQLSSSHPMDVSIQFIC